MEFALTDTEQSVYAALKELPRRTARREWVRSRLARSTRTKCEIAAEVVSRYGVSRRTSENDVRATFEAMTVTIGRRRGLRHRLGEAFSQLLEKHADDDDRTPLRDQVVLLKACADYWKLHDLEAEEVLEQPELEAKFVETLAAVFPKLSPENQERVRSIVSSSTKP